MLPNMFIAYIRLIFRGSFVEILRILYTNNIAVVISTKVPLKMSLIYLETCWVTFNKNCVK
jgi:hypothetical protein